METMECILTRRSIRSFIPDKEIAEETMRQLMEAVRWAPSWASPQTWEVVVVKDRDLKQKLVDAAGANRAAQAILDACAVMVFCSRRGIAGAKQGEYSTNKGDWYMFDCALAAQNFCLAAHSMGLGTVYIGRFEHRQVDTLLGLPQGIESVVMIPLGYPAVKEVKAPPRKASSEFVHAERFGRRYFEG